MAAAAVVSVTMGVMKPVLDKLTTLMGDEYKKIKGLRKQVTFLQRELRDMDALLEKMDSADELDPQAKHWRTDIIEMTYNIEDCIDDFMHRIGEAGKNSGKLSRACKYLTTFMDRRRLANEFQEIKTQVMEASERRKRYMLDQCISVTAPVAIDPRVSTFYNDTASLVGIETQRDELIEWATDKGQQLKLMAIVGLGGLGKTTLANEAYRGVGGKFDCKAFVCVSQKPEMIGLLNSLLSQLGLGTYSHACQVQDPINKLRGYLQDRRYFVVVDDLWDLRAWDTIRCAFPQNDMFSRVIITTRHENVAKSCCGNSGWIHTMKPLSEPDSRRLFFNRIFGSEDDCPSELVKPSYEILKRCDGLPLAIITMASMLGCHVTKLEGQWESIQQSLATNFATKSKYEDMMYILDLSYRYLPRQLKACFLYLGSYPEDHEIERDELVRRWVAEGFVTNSEGHDDVWDVAESYFNELVNRSMIQPTYNGCLYGCRVHDMLLELIGRRCKEDNFLYLVNIDDPHAASKMKDKVIRRLTIVDSGDADDNEAARTTVGNISQIRSLTLLGVPNWRPSLLLEFKFVRVLSLRLTSGAMDLTDINKLSQLRYLKVERDVITEVKIKGLRLLETLDLSSVYNHRCSVEIVDAPRLSHLTMGRGMMILPDWIGKFKLLRTLGWFTLPTDSLEGLIGLGGLTALSVLLLDVPWQCAPSVKATMMSALAASLKNLCKLRELFVMSSDHVALCADALGSLLSPPFHHNLEALRLSHWTFSGVPRWMGHLRNLRELCMGVKEILQEDVVIIGTQLPSLLLLSLRIPGIPTGRIVIGGSTGFPAVERFYFDCDRMSFLRFEAGAMPRLREMTVFYDADKWDKAPPCGLEHLPPSVEEIKASRAIYRRSSAGRPPVIVCISGVFRGVWRSATRPASNLEGGYIIIRPREEEDYLRNEAQMKEIMDEEEYY